MIVLLTDIDKQETYFSDISEFCFLSNLKSPATELIITINLKIPIKTHFNKIKLIYKNSTIFEGYIDQQTVSSSPLGLNLKIFARSRACFLLDNQARPQTYHNLSLKELLDSHISPYGFSYEKIDPHLLSISLNSFTVFPKMSEWSVLNSFLNQTLNITPFITDNNQITASFIDSPFSISNSLNQNSPSSLINFNYSYLSSHFHNTGLVSDIFIKNKNSSFNQITNKLAYKNHLKSRRFSLLSKNAATNILATQNQNSFSLSLTIPELFPSNIGHKVTVIDDIIDNKISDNKFIIDKLYFIFKNNELNSYLSLFSQSS